MILMTSLSHYLTSLDHSLADKCHKRQNTFQKVSKNLQHARCTQYAWHIQCVQYMYSIYSSAQYVQNVQHGQCVWYAKGV